jgi:centromere protein J
MNMREDRKHFETFSNHETLSGKPQNQILTDINQIFKEDAFDMERFYQQYDKVQAPPRKPSPINIRTFGSKLANSHTPDEGLSNIELPNESVYVPVDDSEMIDLSAIRPEQRTNRHTDMWSIRDKKSAIEIPGSKNTFNNESLYYMQSNHVNDSNIHETSNILEQLEKHQVPAQQAKKYVPKEEEFEKVRYNPKNEKENGQGLTLKYIDENNFSQNQNYDEEFERQSKANEIKINPYDDKPLPATRKTFDQLLQEELSKQNKAQPDEQFYDPEEEFHEEQDSENLRNKPKREFLKKNQGKKLSNFNARENSRAIKNRDSDSRDDSVKKIINKPQSKSNSYAPKGKALSKQSKSQAQLKPVSKLKERPIFDDEEPEFDLESKKKNVQSLMNEINDIFKVNSSKEENDLEFETHPSKKKELSKNAIGSDDEIEYEHKKVYEKNSKIFERLNIPKNHEEIVPDENNNRDSLREFYEIEKQNQLNYNLDNYLNDDYKNDLGHQNSEDFPQDLMQKKAPEPSLPEISGTRVSGDWRKSSENPAKKFTSRMNDLIDDYGKDEDHFQNEKQKEIPEISSKMQFNDHQKWKAKDDEDDYENEGSRDDFMNPNSKKIEQENQKHSKIVEKYFGNQKKSSNDRSSNSIPKDELDNMKHEVERKLNDKIAELQNEITNYKLKNEKLKIEKFKVDEKQKQLDKQLENFESQKQEALRQIEELREEEFKKVKREKQIALRNIKAMENKPNRKEREEIETLKEQLKKVEDEHLVRERKLKATVERQKKKIDDSAEEIEDLRSQIKIYESMRINDNLKSNSKQDVNNVIKNLTNKNVQQGNNRPTTDSNLRIVTETKDSKPVNEVQNKNNRGILNSKQSNFSC